MENYDSKSELFMSSGRLAVGIKYTKDSMDIIEHLSDIGYVLFHTRRDEGQHLFAVNAIPFVKENTEIEDEIYQNVATTKMYVVVSFIPVELDVANVHSGKKEFSAKELRYDAQYANIEELR
jgi:hypothetical protein